MNIPKSDQKNLKNSVVNPSLPGLLPFFILFKADKISECVISLSRLEESFSDNRFVFSPNISSMGLSSMCIVSEYNVL